MRNRHWINHSHPQTLTIAIVFSYINAVFGVLNLLSTGTGIPLVFALLFFVIPVSQGVVAIYLANDRKWAWSVAVGLAASIFVLLAYGAFVYSIVATNIIGIAFDIAMVVLLLHDHTRKYVKIWFH